MNVILVELKFIGTFMEGVIAAKESDMMFNKGFNSPGYLNLHEMNDVKAFAENVEKHVASMEQGGWFSKDNRMRGWIIELRKGCLEREMATHQAWGKVF